MKAEDIDYLICGDGRVKLTIPGFPAFEDEPAAEEPLEHQRFECPCGEVHDDEWSLLAALSHALAEDRANERRAREAAEKRASGPETLLFNQATFTAPTSLWNWKWFWIAAGCAVAALFLLKEL